MLYVIWKFTHRCRIPQETSARTIPDPWILLPRTAENSATKTPWKSCDQNTTGPAIFVNSSPGLRSPARYFLKMSELEFNDRANVLHHY